MRPIPRLLHLYALLIPFPFVGVALNEAYVLSLATVVGFVYAGLFLRSHGVRTTHLAYAAMLLAFLATAAFRHGVGTYVLSLGALTLAAAPMTAPQLASTYVDAFHRGLVLGFKLTVAWIAVSIILQVTGLTGLAGPFESSVVHPEAGTFLNYYRPIAGFSEPSHLALYLCFAFVYFDLVRKEGSDHLGERLLAAGAVLATGSVSALLTLVVYVVGRNFRIRPKALGEARGPSMWRRLAWFAGVCAVLGYLATELLAGFADEYLVRIVRAYEDAISMNLVGSEGSRINALLALPEYWSSNGAGGLLFGTGYANYRGWLLGTYGDLGEAATFARGEIDNVFVAIVLSTGLFGFAFYLRFITRALGSWGTRHNLAVVFIFVGYNFSIGFLISGLYWSLLFMLAVSMRQRQTVADRRGESSDGASDERLGQRPQAEAQA